MPAGKHKSRTFRRVFVRTPGARTIIHYRKRKPKAAKCGECDAVLKGVPRERPYKMKNMPKSKKKPERPYGGNLCSKCTRRAIIIKVRTVKKTEEKAKK
jgi:large subunit ribosomal protein L34e|tara:strand:+ start:53 stop:349 length:297 start_codon:yes stop_codon:yes gene_type:complete